MNGVFAWSSKGRLSSELRSWRNFVTRRMRNDTRPVGDRVAIKGAAMRVGIALFIKVDPQTDKAQDNQPQGNGAAKRGVGEKCSCVSLKDKTLTARRPIL